MVLTSDDLEIHNIFLSFRDFKFEILEKQVNETKINPNEIIYKHHLGVCAYSGSNSIVSGYSLFSLIIFNLKHIKEQTPTLDWDSKRFPIIKSILKTLKDKGYDLESQPCVLRMDGSFISLKGEHERPLSTCLNMDSNIRFKCVKFLLELGCRVDNYSGSTFTIIKTFLVGNSYANHELLYLLVKYGADVKQPRDCKPKSPLPIDVFNSSYKRFLQDNSEKIYGKEKVKRAKITKKLLEEGINYVNKKEEEIRVKREEEIRVKREEEIRVKREEEIRVKREEVKREEVKREEVKREEEIKIEEGKVYNDKEAGAYLILAVNNIMFLSIYGTFIPKNFNEQMCENIASLFKVVKDKMNPETLKKMKPNLPENCLVFL